MNTKRMMMAGVGLVMVLSSYAAMAGRVTTSVKLPLAGEIAMVDKFQNPSLLMLSGMVHVVSQVFQDSDGNLLAGLRVNLADVKGVGSDGTEWVAVGTDQFPPNPIHPPEPGYVSMVFSLIPLGSSVPPNPIEPPTVSVTLVFDEVGNLSGQCSIAGVGVGRLASPCYTDVVPR